MSKNWLTPDRDLLLLLPPSVQEWLPEDHLARFVADVVERLDLTPITGKYAPRHPALPPGAPRLAAFLRLLNRRGELPQEPARDLGQRM